MIARWLVVPVAFAVTIGPAKADITPMTRERISEAEDAGTNAIKDSSIVYVSTCRTKATYGIHTFDVRVMSPFASVASAVFESRKKTPLDLSKWPIDEPDKQSVVVSVDPAALHPSGLPPALPLSVVKVFLRRGDEVIAARRSDSHAVLFPDLDEQHRKFEGGVFYFPLDAFSSEKGDLEIVVVPKSDKDGAEAVLKLRTSLLSRLR
jgi:hypothetical protein